MFWQSQVCTAWNPKVLDGRPLCGCGCAYFNKNQWDTKDGICLNPFQWKAFHCILCRFMCARACIFIENRMWPNICLTSVVYFFSFAFMTGICAKWTLTLYTFVHILYTVATYVGTKGTNMCTSFLFNFFRFIIFIIHFLCWAQSWGSKQSTACGGAMTQTISSKMLA